MRCWSLTWPFRLLHNGRISCFVGAILSGTGLSGSDSDERVYHLLDTSREAMISNNDVQKFAISHRMHSHGMLLLKAFL